MCRFFRGIAGPYSPDFRPKLTGYSCMYCTSPRCSLHAPRGYHVATSYGATSTSSYRFRTHAGLDPPPRLRERKYLQTGTVAERSFSLWRALRARPSDPPPRITRAHGYTDAGGNGRRVPSPGGERRVNRRAAACAMEGT
eukprot:50380-Prymnesium_polylepis.1